LTLNRFLYSFYKICKCILDRQDTGMNPSAFNAFCSDQKEKIDRQQIHLSSYLVEKVHIVMSGMKTCAKLLTILNGKSQAINETHFV